MQRLSLCHDEIWEVVVGSVILIWCFDRRSKFYATPIALSWDPFPLTSAVPPLLATLSGHQRESGRLSLSRCKVGHCVGCEADDPLSFVLFVLGFEVTIVDIVGDLRTQIPPFSTLDGVRHVRDHIESKGTINEIPLCDLIVRGMSSTFDHGVAGGQTHLRLRIQ
ncbi:hypothetical protein BC835DRAFT_136945 [Cytidiella melzeri]|nr:hypothetical protein BC835DRAFT_136945 [Cytidiella melzeri]